MTVSMFVCRKWPIKCPERLFKNKSFWVDVYMGWALNWTWTLIKKLKKEKQQEVSGKEMNHKNHEILSKLITKILLFLFFILAPSFNWAIKRT